MRRLLCSALLLAALAAAQPRPQKPLARLETNIDRITKSVNATWGIYIKCLETGEEIALNADQQMDTMSVIKIPLMVEAFRQMEEGKFALTDRVTLTDAMKRSGTGVIRSLDAGATLTIKDMLTLMIIVSDNTATDVMYDRVGGIEPINRLMDSYGLKSIRATGTAKVWFDAIAANPSRDDFHRQAKTPFGLSSPRDMGKLLEKIEKGEAVSKKASMEMLQMMRGQVYSSRLPKYVTGFRVPHKTGDFLPYIGNDVGVLESANRNVVMSVFTARHFGIGASLEDAIGRIAELTANYFSSIDAR
jgi:beta-lactamase class A